MMSRLCTAFVSIFVIFFAQVVMGEVRNVPSGSYPTIQSAINASVNGDYVVVNQGTYYENITTDGKAITIQSVDPGDMAVVRSTVINGRLSGSCITINDGEDEATVIKGLTITNGSAEYGGGIYCYTSSPVIANCIFVSNSSASRGGGGVCCRSSSNAKITNCLFVSNTAIDGAGVLAYYYSSPEISNCVFIKNAASRDGGGVMVSNRCSDVKIVNCTFYGNTAKEYGGGIRSFNYSNCELHNSIVWENSSDQISLSNSTVNAYYSCVQGGYAGLGVISDDPCFVFIRGRDYILGTVDDDASINPGPCVDAGDYMQLSSDFADLDGDGVLNEIMPLDVNGNPRFVDNEDIEDGLASYYPGVAAIDMGACEWQLPVPIAGDLDGDWDVDIMDLIIFTGNWCKRGAAFMGDMDGDRVVDMADWMIFADSWQEQNFPIDY